jgi:hypothetical protein
MVVSRILNSSHTCCYAARERLHKNESGAKFKSDLLAEEAKLRAIRDRMIADLEQKGVNPKYLGEMKAVDIGKILRR